MDDPIFMFPIPYATWRPQRVLVVDDDLASRVLLSELLRSAGYAVETAENGARAFRVSLTGCFDLILMDYRMPGLDGSATASAIRASGCDTPILLVTGFDAPECPAADGVLCKPISPRTFADEVSAWL